MRSVYFHLVETNYQQIEAMLSRKYPREGDYWHIKQGEDVVLYISFYEDFIKELEDGEVELLQSALGGKIAVSLAADVSGKHPGDEQVKKLAEFLLGEIRGVAQDDYTANPWTLEGIQKGWLVEGHPFFDYQGWYDDEVQ